MTDQPKIIQEMIEVRLAPYFLTQASLKEATQAMLSLVEKVLEKVVPEKLKVPRIDGQWTPEDDRNNAKNQIIDDIQSQIKKLI